MTASAVLSMNSRPSLVPCGIARKLPIDVDTVSSRASIEST